MKYALNQRLFEFLENQGISNVEFQKAIGVNRAQQISSWKKLHEPIPQDHIISAITLYGKLNGHWLLTGDGEMLIGIEGEKKIYSDIQIQNPSNEPCNKCEVLQAKLDGANALVESQKQTISALLGETKKEMLPQNRAQEGQVANLR